MNEFGTSEYQMLISLYKSASYICFLLFPDNASRPCSPTGEWGPTTDYTDCMCNSTEDCHGGGREDETGALEISIIIYLVGYVLSFLALCGALAIFLSFR